MKIINQTLDPFEQAARANQADPEGAVHLPGDFEQDSLNILVIFTDEERRAAADGLLAYDYKRRSRQAITTTLPPDTRQRLRLGEGDTGSLTLHCREYAEYGMLLALGMTVLSEPGPDDNSDQTPLEKIPRMLPVMVLVRQIVEGLITQEVLPADSEAYAWPEKAV